MNRRGDALGEGAVQEGKACFSKGSRKKDVSSGSSTSSCCRDPVAIAEKCAESLRRGEEEEGIDGARRR